MKGYLLREQTFIPGENVFVESTAAENNYGVVFEDDTETGYFYALEISPEGEQRILDALHIYEVENVTGSEKPHALKIIWSTDWLKCALVINNYCHAVFDFKNHGGYNRNAFPPPNEFWTTGERTLTDEMIEEIFS